MNPSVYLETTIIGYRASRLSSDLITAANQQLTHDWWDNHRANYDLFVSEPVFAECGAGDPEAAGKRLELLDGIPVLEVNEAAEILAGELVSRIPLPEKARVDALHIAIATANGIDYLLTWNCAHIANAAFQQPIALVCRSLGYEPPTICTPQQLMET